jgi:hypothetical protein
MIFDTDEVRVNLGERVYSQCAWRRTDDIFMGQTKIGIIKLSSTNRAGFTICLATSRCIAGRNVQWCVEQCAGVCQEKGLAKSWPRALSGRTPSAARSRQGRP